MPLPDDTNDLARVHPDDAQTDFPCYAERAFADEDEYCVRCGSLACPWFDEATKLDGDSICLFCRDELYENEMSGDN